MLIRTEKGVVIKSDWSPERIGLAHRERNHTVTRAEDFAQSLLLPGPRVRLLEPRPVEPSTWMERLVRLCNP